MKKTEELQHLKDLMTIVNDPYVKKPVKDKAWLELWNDLETPVAKIVQKTLSNYYYQDRPSSDLVNDAVLESMMWIITHSKSWDPNRGAAPATWAFRKIAQITMSVVGIENVTLDVDESNEEGALEKQALELRLHEESVAGRTSGTSYAGDFEVEHPFDMLEKLALSASLALNIRSLLNASARQRKQPARLPNEPTDS